MFPDRATLYVVAIEDRQYKDFKIHCKYASAHTYCLEVTTGVVLNEHLSSVSVLTAICWNSSLSHLA